MTTLLERLSVDVNEIRGCPDCGQRAMYVSEKPYSFLHRTVELSAVVPVWKCKACGCEYTDGRGEEIEYEAVCQYLGLLTPREICGIRKQYSLSRKELARLTRFGEASIKRWEIGALFQNASADRFLRLIKNDSRVVEKLRDIENELAK
jgi:putative zinc finger/helix-turn-helix YgiT family protein